jgi:hypothetical protein
MSGMQKVIENMKFAAEYIEKQALEHRRLLQNEVGLRANNGYRGMQPSIHEEEIFINPDSSDEEEHP